MVVEYNTYVVLFEYVSLLIMMKASNAKVRIRSSAVPTKVIAAMIIGIVAPRPVYSGRCDNRQLN